MDEIKTNFDKIMEQFTDSVTQHTMPKRLSFGCGNNSFDSTVAKKRKLSAEESPVGKNTSANVSVDQDGGQSSLNNSLISSPWEKRRLRADLIEANSRIAKLKKEIEHQHTIRSSMEIMYNSKTASLQQQCDFTASKVLDLEKHLAALRKREANAKQDLVKTKNSLNQQKQIYEDTIYTLQKENKELEEKCRAAYNKCSNEIGQYKRELEQLEMELNLRTEELENSKRLQNEYKQKATEYQNIKSQLETEKQQHELVKSRVKDLEYEVASYGEWKELTKTTQARLCSLPDIEKELARVKQENKNLRDALGNKLLLEEQVFDLKTRLEKYDEISTDTVALKVEINTLEQELKEWRDLAADHCPVGSPQNAMFLRNRIEQLLQKDIVTASEKGFSKNENDLVQSQMHEMKIQNEIYIKANNELKTALKHHKNLMSRVQKKLMLVAKERDCYKQLVDNFERDLTISGQLVDALNPDSQLRARLEMLEKTLAGYKEMCTNLEKELASTKLLPEIPLEVPNNLESYDRLKKEIETLRIENDKLRRRKDELELELEHRYLKGDVNVDKCKVLHLTMNPAAEAYEKSKTEIEKLQAEIERLKRKNKKLEEDQEEMTSRLNETQNLTVNVKEINSLRTKLESAETKMQHMKELYKNASLEFREVCYMLFGYRIDRVGFAVCTQTTKMIISIFV
ncbi:mitotic spindle assembly checkpoint protein MAD1 isoform X2 [Hermetia illucens]|uniref:mitotic spindle assembly checkpoint protein MAD1 isoform X2 n=1 Tax=Hermetia illucens TaxID=343691 RepID=UPI0018CC141A|nr:mitotic spindle assembly checkpoint protein MAD1 isoform X2 [Hermetia illucens]